MLDFREIQIKTTMISRITPTRMAITKMEIISVGEDVKKLEHSLIAYENVK